MEGPTDSRPRDFPGTSRPRPSAVRRPIPSGSRRASRIRRPRARRACVPFTSRPMMQPACRCVSSPSELVGVSSLAGPDNAREAHAVAPERPTPLGVAACFRQAAKAGKQGRRAAPPELSKESRGSAGPRGMYRRPAVCGCLRRLDVGQELLDFLAKRLRLFGEFPGGIQHLRRRTAGLGRRLGDAGDVGVDLLGALGRFLDVAAVLLIPNSSNWGLPTAA